MAFFFGALIPLAVAMGLCWYLKKKKEKSWIKSILISWLVCTVLSVISANIFGEVPNMSEKQQDEQTDTVVVVSVQQLMGDLDSNAARAKDKYCDCKLALTGKISNIDSDCKYFNLSTGDVISLAQIQIKLTNESQRNTIKELNVGDVVNIEGICTDVGEVLGYTFEASSISSAN